MQEDKEKEMTKDVVVSLKGLQLAPDQQSDAVEVIAPGEYYIRNNKHYVLFEEIMEGETQTLKNMLKFNDNYLEFTRKGPMSVHMIFEKGKKNLTYYYTPFGSIQIGIDVIESVSTGDESAVGFCSLMAVIMVSIVMCMAFTKIRRKKQRN